MGALAIVLWIIALSAGAFFPPLFIAPIYATYLWYRQRKRRAVVAALAKNKPIIAPSPPLVSVADELGKLAELHASGHLTAIEFDEQKRRLLQN
jgi:Short C-terminal domain